MDFLHGVSNFLWSTSAAVGNIGYNTSQAIYEQVFGGRPCSTDKFNVSSGSIRNLWYGKNTSGLTTSNPLGGGGTSQFDVRRKDVFMMWSQVYINFVQVAGISGALAVCMAAYGYLQYPHDTHYKELKQVFDIANKMHLIHSAALLAVSMTPQPFLAGVLMSVGILLFCGSCYYHAITGVKSFVWLTPIGGLLLIIAWLSIAI